MKSFLIAVIAALLTEGQAVSIKQMSADPIPEKPNQYHRVCDELQGDKEDCWAGNGDGERYHRSCLYKPCIYTSF